MTRAEITNVIRDFVIDIEDGIERDALLAQLREFADEVERDAKEQGEE